MKKIYQIFGIIFFILVISTVLAFKHFCPIFNPFSEPTGQFTVGTMNQHWADANLHYEPQERNEFNVELIYPSSLEKKSVKPTPYYPERMAIYKKLKAQESWLPAVMIDCMFSGITRNAQPQAPLAHQDKPFPIIIYLPGIAGPDLHAYYLEEMASHGYVVVAIEPPFDIAATIFPGNKVIEVDPTLKKAIEVCDRDAIYAYRDKAHERWSAYIESALKKLAELNNDQQSPFYKKLDVERFGLLGHSHGGAVALDYCQKHANCKTGINMDGWTKTYNSSQAFKTPFAILVAEGCEQPGITELFKNNERDDFKKVTVHGAEHGAFTDAIQTKWPLSSLEGIATDVDNVRHIIRQSLVSFFDAYLKSK